MVRELTRKSDQAADDPEVGWVGEGRRERVTSEEEGAIWRRGSNTDEIRL